MEENPDSPAQSELAEPPIPPRHGPLMPWEDRENYPRLWDRILQTLKTLLRPSEAGKALRGARKILPSMSFMALVGMAALATHR